MNGVERSWNLLIMEPLRAGFSHKLSLQCKICGILEIFHSSPATDNANPDSIARRSMFDINRRSVVAFREIGKGHKAMSTFAGFMNLSKPISNTQYDKSNEKRLKAYEDACFQSCKEAAIETTAKLGGGSDSVTDCQVSVDGTWQKHGHSLLWGCYHHFKGKWKVFGSHCIIQHMQRVPNMVKQDKPPWMQ